MLHKAVVNIVGVPDLNTLNGQEACGYSAGANPCQTQGNPSGASHGLVPEKGNQVIAHANTGKVQVGIIRDQPSHPVSNLLGMKPASGRRCHYLCRIEGGDGQYAVHDISDAIFPSCLAHVGQLDICCGISHVELDDSRTTVATCSQNRTHGIVKAAGRNGEATNAPVRRHVSVEGGITPWGVQINILSGNAVAAPSRATVCTGSTKVLGSCPSLATDRTQSAIRAKVRPANSPEGIRRIEVPLLGVYRDPFDNHALGSGENHMAARAAATATAHAVEEVGVLTASPFTAVGEHAAASLNRDALKSEDPQTTAAATATGTFLVAGQLKGLQSE